MRRGMTYRLICLLLLTQLACLGGPRRVEPTYLQGNSPKRIWVTTTGGDQMIIEHPRVYGDSLLGFTNIQGSREEVWMSLTNLQEVRARRMSTGRTALALAAIGGAFALMLFVIKGAGATGERPCMNEGEPCEG